ncbi:MAG: DNA topology modulation protein FlaR [Dehalococcoidia bacterium]|jgi:adenylate kinase family enzyme|nr:DNA topology modulation protein FlaR [Dehalococcoidia bacterium]
MTAKRIHILGGSCAGKTTIARALSDRLGIAYHALDDMHWDNSGGYLGIRRDPEERQRLLSGVLDRESWIVEGVYYNWLADAFQAADVIVILDHGTWTRQARMIRRFVRGKLGREDGQEEGLRSLWETFRWNHRYDRINLPATRRFISSVGRSWTDCRTFEDVMKAADADAG